ncbi:glycoside hydrolase family 7 protein [Tulasnella calospora MUT 4182]|uniref:Glucanase n=1 Tax=Tulasnella calospora MUT 4182 TaxID=1051891 RepID=A0A0C3KMM1_9AGAM|nr:glycoside hydrolase family 7 protein [Tulasnella calospora MUT 4182]
MGSAIPMVATSTPSGWENPRSTAAGRLWTLLRSSPVVTQFISDNGTSSGSLTEIRRKYIQDGVPITNSYVNVPRVDPSLNSITFNYCDQQKAAFLDRTSFQDRGGLNAVGEALKRGMVLVLSIYDDRDAHMLWLNSQYPPGASQGLLGVARGICATTSGVPDDVEAMFPTSSVTISNSRFGPIGSTVY